MHGYIVKSIESDPKIDHKTSKSGTKNKDMSSEFEAYAFAIKTKKLLRNTKRQKGGKEIHQTPSLIQNADFVKALMRTLLT